MPLDMEKHRRIAISFLRDAVLEIDSQIAELANKKDHLEGSIRALEGAYVPSGNLAERMAAATSYPAPEGIAAIVDRMEKAAIEKAFPFEKLEGLTRSQAAIAIAQYFDGYITTRAFAKIIGESGVLKGTKQLGSVASRVLVHSDDFMKISEGLFRLKNQEAPNGAS